MQLTIIDNRKRQHFASQAGREKIEKDLRPPRRGWLRRLFRRDQPATFHRCLAVHLHFAGNASALDQ